MADKEMPTLTDATTPLDGTETLIITQDGDSRECSAQDIADLIPAGYAGYFVTRMFAPTHDADVTINTNTTTYQHVSHMLVQPMDLDIFPFTHFRIYIGRGQANAASQTVTAQLDSGTTGAAPASAAGNDLVVTNTQANFDSGWIARTDALTGFQIYRLLLKGSNSTVDLLCRTIDLMFKID